MTNTYNSSNLLCLDFDGVIHAYTTPWQGADKIPDPSVPGAIEWLLQAFKRGYDIAIFSARSSQPGGIPAMRYWLKKELILWLNKDRTLKDQIKITELADYKPQSDDRQYEVALWADGIVNKVVWCTTKLPSKLYIDDNAHRFEGTWPSFDEVDKMESWVKE